MPPTPTEILPRPAPSWSSPPDRQRPPGGGLRLQLRGTRWLGTLLVALACITGLPAADSPRRVFEIPAGDAALTLKQFSDQSGEQVIYPVDRVRGLRTHAVTGALPAREALERMLAGTGLAVVVDPRTGAIAIGQPAGAARTAAPANSRPASTPARAAIATAKPRTLLRSVAGWLTRVPPPLPDPDAVPAPDSEVIRLSPFNVTSARDTGYTATNSLVGGRLASPLQELPSAVSVLTRDFLDDIAATDLLGAAQYFPNAVPGAPAGMSDYAVSLRGFPSGFLYRNFFISYVNPDSYVIERLDAARGPNALVFGDTKAGGTLNLTTRQARFRNFSRVSHRFSSEGGLGRTTGDFNFKLNERLAVRAAALHHDENDWIDYTYLRRRGGFATATWTPFRHTQVRIEGERYRQNQSSPWLGSVLRDGLGGWDGTTTYDAGDQPLVAGSGTARLSANHRVFAPGTGLGVIDWSGWAQTTGTSFQLDTQRPAHLPASMPTLPYRGYNLRLGDGGDTELTHRTLSAFVEQQVGDRLFLELAASYARQQREQSQLSSEILAVDINRRLPDGRANPNFGQRYTETPPVGFTTQRNTLHEARVSAAYLTPPGAWSEHRLLLGASYRRDAYRDLSRQVVLDVPGVRFQNPAANPYAFRLRIYENQRGTALTLPAGVRSGRWSVSPGEDKDLASAQFAASSRWFPDRRLVTLVGVRHDKLRKPATVARVDPATGEFIGYLERYTGPAATGLSGAGGLQEFKPVITRTAGAVHRLGTGVSAYVSYSEGYDTSNFGLLLDPATGQPGTPLPAKESRGREAGLKFSLWNQRLTGALGWYRNEQRNDSNTGVGFPRNEINRLWSIVDDSAASPRQIPGGVSEIIDYRGRGVEFEFTASLSPHWRAMANIAFPTTERRGGYARTLEYYRRHRPEWQRTLDRLVATGDSRALSFQTDLQTIDSRLASVANGLPLAGTLRYTANLFTTYEFPAGPLHGLRLGGGANLRGPRYVSFQPRVAGDPDSFERLDSRGYALFSLVASHRLSLGSRAVLLRLNIENLFDAPFKRFTSFTVVNPAAEPPRLQGNSYLLQAPRRFILTTEVRF